MSKNFVLCICISLLLSCSTKVQEKDSKSTDNRKQDISLDNNTIANNLDLVETTENQSVIVNDSLAFQQEVIPVTIDFSQELFITDYYIYKLEGFYSTQNIPTKCTHIAKYTRDLKLVEYIPMELINNFPNEGIKFYKGIEACKIWGYVTDSILVGSDGEDSVISHIESYEVTLDINNQMQVDTLP